MRDVIEACGTLYSCPSFLISILALGIITPERSNSKFSLLTLLIKISTIMYAPLLLLLSTYIGGALATPLISPFLLRRDTGSSTNPYCTYNQGCGGGGSEYIGICHGQPNEDYCAPAINATCTALVATAAGNSTTLATRIGTGVSDGANADCVAVSKNGKNPPPDMATCLQKFAEIQGCFETTNVGYGANCVGGSINLSFCTTSAPIIDGNLPTYQLGTPLGVDQGDLSSNPPGTLGAGNGDSSSSTGANAVSAAVAGPETSNGGTGGAGQRAGAAGGGAIEGGDG